MSRTEPHTDAPFLGRSAELGELLAGLEQAEQGRGRLILLGGEPGIGKSRLADELASRARDRGHLVLWGRGWEDAGAPPYWPWVQVLRSYARQTDVDDLRRQMGSGAIDIAQMLPELRDLLADLPPPRATESDAARFQLFDSTTTFLRNAAADRRLVVIVDDLQAADTPSIRFLRFLASQLTDIGLLAVGTYRDVELTPEHPLTSAIAELAREPITRTVALAGLRRDALRDFIVASVGVMPDDRLVSAVARATKGNPLFVAEAVRLLSAEGRLDELSSAPSLRVAVPAGVREVIARRIDRLADGTGRVLSLGAALGPEFSLEVLRVVAGDEATELLDGLDEAVREGLLLEVSGSARRFRFSHDLVRETIYGELTPGRRVRLHRRVADGLDELYASEPERHLAELAYHYYEAEQEGRPSPKAVDYARRAGDHAARSLAFEEAARLYRMALAAMDRSHVQDPGIRIEVLLALGDAEARGGDLGSSRTSLLQAAEQARRIGAAPQLARAALGIGGRIPWARPGSETRLIPLLQDALVHLGGTDERLRVRLLTRLACAWRSTPEQLAQCASLSQQAVEIARTLDDAATLSYALAGRFWATWGPDNSAARLLLAREMATLAQALGDGERLIDAHLMLWLSHTELGDVSAARREGEEVHRLVVELRQPAQLWLGTAPRVLMALMEGEFAAAENLIGEESDPGSYFTLARDNVSAGRMHRFLLRREQGRLAEEEANVRASAEEFPWYPLHRSALACLLLELGREREARAVFDELARDEFSALYPDNEWLLGMSLAAEACAGLADSQAAATLYRQLSPFAGRHAIGHAEGSVGAVDRYLGVLAATMGRLEDAERHMTDSIGINERMGARPWTAHSQHDLAEMLRRRDGPGDRERAAELDRAALMAAREMGMTALGARIEVEEAPVLRGPAEPGAGIFRQEGEYWTVGLEGESVRVRDAKGMRYLARLLDQPGHEVLALDLAATLPERPPAAAAAALGLEAQGRDDAGPVLDTAAKAAYRERVDELRSELAQAEEWNDTERASAARHELDFLGRELASAVGLGGRDRTAASATERARISVTRAIRGALERIASQSPALGAHLQATVHTGTYCSYTPDPRVPITWET